MRLALLLLLACSPVALAGPGGFKEPPRKSKVVIYDALSVAQAQALLAQRGITSEVMSAPGRNTALKFELSGFKVLLVLGDGGSGTAADAYLYTGFATPIDPPVGHINRWNQGARFTRAYLDAEGDPVLESDLRLAGGITGLTFFDFLDTYRTALTAFTEHIGWRG